MSTQAQVRKFEILSGIFGWVWLLTIPCWLWFLGTAVFSDGPWTRFLIVFVVGFVAKNMVRGFEAHKRRVALQAQLIAEGMPHQTAHELAYAAMNGGEAALNKRMSELGIK